MPATASAIDALLSTVEGATKELGQTGDKIVDRVQLTTGAVVGTALSREVLFGAGGDEKPEGRRISVSAEAIAELARVQVGDLISLSIPESNWTGTIHLVQDEETGWRSVAGTLPAGGAFTFARKANEIGGSILFPRERRAFELRMEADLPVLVERRMAEMVCLPSPRAEEPEEVASSGRAAAARASIPLLSSRPAASAVLYLDFDGATVTDPVWNGGQTIEAPPSTLNATAITEVWNRVKEDYWPFNIDVTTNPARYDQAAVGKRMRCIITSNDAARPGSGGVAWIGSFDRAGRSGYGSATVPCWVFNQNNAKTCADTISHEFGHTFGLHHDGNAQGASESEREYYSGHGTGNTAWGPIMGSPYNKALSQWSKGEYAGSNNHEDDLAIIANSANGFGYIADEAGGSLANAARLARTGNNSVNQEGVIHNASDVDLYRFSCGGSGRVMITVAPAAVGPNADLQLELLSNDGSVLVADNPAQTLNASVSRSLTAGTYYVRISGAGKSPVSGTGYSAYGSTGAYRLSGTIPSEGFDLVAALDDDTLLWSTTGQSSWVPQKTITHDGEDAAQVSKVASGEQADLSTTVSGPAEMSFWWRASTTPQVDFLVLLVDGSERLRISGEQDWDRVSLPLSAGSHTVTWRYLRNSTGVPEGRNAAWLDEIELSPLAPRSGTDHLAAAPSIVGRLFRVAADNSEATTEAGEPQHTGQGSAHSLWWSWTAPETGIVSVSTKGSLIPTNVAIYQQRTLRPVRSFDDLTPVTSAGSTSSAPQATAQFAAEAGQTYAIAVAGAYGASGPIRLTIAYRNPSNFTGLLIPTDNSTNPGLITFTVTRDLRFTCQARIGTSVRTFLGELPAEGPNALSGVFGNALTITSAQGLGSDHLAGTLQVNGQSYRYIAAAELPTTDQPAVSYNFTAGSAEFSPAIPGGLTYAHLDLRRGRIRAVGVAGDGSKFTASGFPTVDQSWPMWSHNRRLGTLSGNFFFDQEQRRLSGTLGWMRGPDSLRPAYQNSLDLKMEILGCRYDSYRKIFPGYSASIAFSSDPSLEMPGDRTLVLTVSGQATPATSGTPFSLRFTGNTGLFNGTAIDPVTGKKVKFGGASLDALGCAAGAIALPEGSGQVLLTP